MQLNPKDADALAIVARMDALFAVDAEARRQLLSVNQRHLLRQRRSTPPVENIRDGIDATQARTLPATALSKACQYTLTLWKRLTQFLEHPIIELSNNLAENSIRPIAVGRRNWIHIGSGQAGPKIAAILSAVESCRRLKIPVRDYLGAILPGLSTVSIQRLP